MGENDYSCLSEDLLVEILSWLPVISLVRFRCVCKSWYILFQNPKFISKHLNNSIIADEHRRFITGSCTHDTHYRSLSYKTLDPIKKDLGFRCHGYERLLGSYNGIVCLSNDRGEASLWNPAIRQMKVLDDSRIATPYGRQLTADCGFGYDFKTNDYKVVKIIAMVLKCLKTKRRKIEQRVEIYSLSTDSWRLIDGVIPYCMRTHTYLKACVNGIYCKLVYKHGRRRDGNSCVLFTFDMGNEVFIGTPMPEGLDYKDLSAECNALSALKSSIALTTCQIEPRAGKLYFEVFVLNECGPNGTWTKLYKIGPLSDFCFPMVFWKNDQLFFDRWEDLVLYDPTTHELKSLQIGGPRLQLLEYTESLVPVHRGYHRFQKEENASLL